MEDDIIRICDAQKLIFAKKILGITRQILEACAAEDPKDISGLMKERYNYILRIKKCDTFTAAKAADAVSADLSTHQDFEAVIRTVRELNRQIEASLQSKRKELITKFNLDNAVKSAYNKISKRDVHER
jgi:hypothetical protein